MKNADSSKSQQMQKWERFITIIWEKSFNYLS